MGSKRKKERRHHPRRSSSVLYVTAVKRFQTCGGDDKALSRGEGNTQEHRDENPLYPRESG